MTDARTIREVICDIDDDLTEAIEKIVACSLRQDIYVDLGGESLPVASALNDHFDKSTWMNLRGEAVE